MAHRIGTLAVVLFLASASAWAQTPEDTPVPADAPTVEPAPAPAPEPTPAPAATPAPAPVEEHKVTLAEHHMPSIWLQAGAGAGAALISVPVALYVGGWVGNLTNNVYLGLLSWALVATFLPSLAVTAAVVGIGNYYSPGTFPFWRVWGLTSIANALALYIATIAGVSVGMFGTILLFAICEAIVLPAVAVPSARWLAKPPPEGVPPSNRLSSLEPWNPGAATRWFVPAAEVSF